MDLMSVTTSYKSLAGKYNNFLAPTYEIKVGGSKLVTGEKLQITELEVELTSEYEASGCVFYVVGEYDPKKTDFTSDVDMLQIGQKIEVELGYIRTEQVFVGYINQVDYEFGMGDQTWRIRVECMDAKGVLMKRRRLEFFKEKSADKVVNAILGEQPVSSYITGKKLDSCPEDEIALRANMMTDYDLIVEQAKKMGYEFFIVQGTVYFREKEKVTSPVMKLTPKHGIRNARLTLSGQGLFKTAEVRSIDEENAQLITGSANISGKFSDKGMDTKLLGTTKQVFYEPGVKDASEARKRAQIKVERAAESFGMFECECIGIPELGPGRFIEIDELAKNVDKKYYITQVRHRIDEEGYRTVLRARVKSL
ncbi:MAG: phage late control D family protein [Roseburia sp.]